MRIRESEDTAFDLAEQEAASRLSAAENAAWGKTEAGLRDAERGFTDQSLEGHPNEEESAAQRLADQEAASGGWQTTVGENNASGKKTRRERLRDWGKKRGGIIGFIFTLGLSGAILTIIFTPASMLINLMENITTNQDPATIMSERRLARNISNMLTKTGPCNSKKMACRAQTISYKGLNRMKKYGVVPLDSAGQPMELKRSGYPEKGNPTAYNIDGKTVKAADLPGFLSQPENRKVAAKLFGRMGAFNMRFRTWSSKYLAKRFYGSFANIKRNGGIASLPREEQTPSGSKSHEQHRQRLEGHLKDAGTITEADLTEAGNKVAGATNEKLGHAKKAGAAYTAAVAGCITARIPGLIAAGVASVQLARLVPLVHNFILSPGSQQKASGLGKEFAMDPKGVEFVGNALTEVTTDAETGRRGSALDSPYLLAAMGVNKSRLSPIDKYVPGLAVLRNPVVQGFNKAKDASAASCNVIMSDAAMYSAMAADATVTILSSSIPLIGIIKVAAGFVFAEISAQVAQQLLETFASEALKAVFATLAGEDIIPKARGIVLGDLLGYSALAAFPAAGIAKSLPVLSESSLASYDQVRLANEQTQREYDLALLSPLDTSSRYTFLGSIAFQLRQSMIASGSMNGSVSSILSNIVRLPATAFLSRSVGASLVNSTTQCSYAKEFDMANDQVTPAINAAMLPCVGLTEQQANMDPGVLRENLEKAGWLNADVDIEPGDNLETLRSKGYIVHEKPVDAFLLSCSDASSGSYITEVAGCITDNSGSSSATLSGIKGVKGVVEENGELVDDPSFNSVSTEDPTLLASIPVALLDIQVRNSINGEDEEDILGGGGGAEGGAPAAVGEGLDNITMFYQGEDPWQSQNYGHGSIRACGCGPTSLAAIVSSLTPNKSDPKKMSDFFVQNNGQMSPNCGSYWIWESKKNVFKEKFGITVTKVQPSAENARKGLDSGGLVLLSVGGKTPFTSSGHIMFIRGATADGKFLVGDPASRKRTQNASGFSVDQFAFGQSGGTVGMWVITGSGGQS